MLSSFTVQEPWFSLIKDKKKIIEGRLCKGKFELMKKGDFINVIKSNENDILTAKIKRISKYSCFKQMLISEGLRNVLPNIQKLEKGVGIYEQFYSKEDQKQFGVLAIKIKIIKNK